MCSGLENYAHFKSADRQNKWFSSHNMRKINELRTSHFVTSYKTDEILTSPPNNPLYCRSAELLCAQDSRTTHIWNPRIDRIRGFRHAVCLKLTEYAHRILPPPTKLTEYAHRLPIIAYIVDPRKCDVLRTRELRTFEIPRSTEYDVFVTQRA